LWYGARMRWVANDESLVETAEMWKDETSDRASRLRVASAPRDFRGPASGLFITTQPVDTHEHDV